MLILRGPKGKKSFLKDDGGPERLPSPKKGEDKGKKNAQENRRHHRKVKGEVPPLDEDIPGQFSQGQQLASKSQEDSDPEKHYPRYNQHSPQPGQLRHVGFPPSGDTFHVH